MKALNFYHIKNIWLEIIKLVIIITTFVGFVLSLRLLNIGKNISTWDLNEVSFSWNIVMLLGFLFLASFIMLISSRVLLDTFYKLHLYLITPMFNYPEEEQFTNESSNYFKYFSILRDLNTDFTLTGTISLKLYRLLNESYTLRKDFLRKLYGDKYVNNILRAQIQINKYSWLRTLLTQLQIICNTLSFIEDYLYHVFPTLLILITFIYDLLHYRLEYIYYALIIFMIINAYRRIVLVCKRVDLHTIDRNLSQYFYKDKVHDALLGMSKNDLSACIKIINSKVSSYEIYNLFDSHPHVVEPYLKNDYIAPHLVELLPIKPKYHPYSGRLLALIVLLLYKLFCYDNIAISYSIVLTTPIILFIIIYEYGYYVKGKYYDQLILYKLLYTPLILISIGILIWICLSRYTLAYITDDLNLGFFTIHQCFSDDVKITFLKAYLSHRANILGIAIEDQTFIFDIIYNLISSNSLAHLSISAIKININNILNDLILLDYLQHNYKSITDLFIKDHYPWIHFLRNFIATMAIGNTLTYYYHFFATFYDIWNNTSRFLHKIALAWWIWFK